MSIFLTIFAGVTVFVLGQIVQRLFIEPIQEQWRLKGRIANVLTYYRSLYRSDKGEPKAEPESLKKGREKCMESIRELAADFRATLTTIPLYRLVSACRLVLAQDVVLEASYLLVKFQADLDNDFLDAHGDYDALKKLLKLPGKDPDITLIFESTSHGCPMEVTLPGNGEGYYLTMADAPPPVELTQEEIAVLHLPQNHPRRMRVEAIADAKRKNGHG